MVKQELVVLGYSLISSIINDVEELGYYADIWEIRATDDDDYLIVEVNFEHAQIQILFDLNRNYKVIVFKDFPTLKDGRVYIQRNLSSLLSRIGFTVLSQ